MAFAPAQGRQGRGPHQRSAPQGAGPPAEPARRTSRVRGLAAQGPGGNRPCRALEQAREVGAASGQPLETRGTQQRGARGRGPSRNTSAE